jgi:hypothetical protein
MGKKGNKSDFEKLSLHQAFVQARLAKGYRFLDLSGIVLNRLGELYEEINIGPGGGVLSKRKNPRDPYAIQFSPDVIWLRYAPLESLEYLVDTANEWISSIARDIEVKNFQTLGLRSQHFVKSADIIKSSTLLAKRIFCDPLQGIIADVGEARDAGFRYMVRVPAGKFVAVVRMNTVRILRAAVEPFDYPSDGLCFDVDIYWRRKEPNLIPRAETKDFLRSAADQTYDLLAKIGYKLMEDVDDNATR